MDYEKPQVEAFYQFLETLDCYNTTKEILQSEELSFSQNQQRDIAAFICKQTSEQLTVQAGYIRILYVLQGTIAATIDGTMDTYQKGTLILTNAQTELSYHLEKNAATLHFYFKASYFTDSLLAQFSEETLLYRFFVEGLSPEFLTTSRYYVFDFAEQTDIHFYTLLLLKQIVKMSYFNNKLTKSAFVLLIVEMSQLADKALVSQDGHVSKDYLIDEVFSYIETHLNTVTLAQTAAYFHFHPNYLSNVVKGKTGQTFTTIVLEKRIEFAKQYLTETELTIQTIIEQLGYKDKAFFYQRFKAYVGMTPRAYRKSKRG